MPRYVPYLTGMIDLSAIIGIQVSQKKNDWRKYIVIIFSNGKEISLNIAQAYAFLDILKTRRDGLIPYLLACIQDLEEDLENAK
jgi:hypothetical protein